MTIVAPMKYNFKGYLIPSKLVNKHQEIIDMDLGHLDMMEFVHIFPTFALC